MNDAVHIPYTIIDEPAMEVSPDVEFREKSLAGLIPSIAMKM